MNIYFIFSDLSDNNIETISEDAFSRLDIIDRL